MIDLPMPDLTTYDLTEPPAFFTPAKGRKKSRRSSSKPRGATGPNYVGAIVLLIGSDGEPFKCRLTYQAPDGQWYCEPLNQ